jgi:hypothetical protein
MRRRPARAILNTARCGKIQSQSLAAPTAASTAVRLGAIASASEAGDAASPRASLSANKARTIAISPVRRALDINRY